MTHVVKPTCKLAFVLKTPSKYRKKLEVENLGNNEIQKKKR